MADDQPTAEARISDLGLGTVMSRRKINGQTLVSDGSMILADKQITENVNRLSKDLRESGGNLQKSRI